MNMNNIKKRNTSPFENDHDENENDNGTGNENDNVNENGEKSSTGNINDKIDLLYLNNGWNDKNERLIANIGENCEIYKRIHDNSSNKYQFNNKIISIIIIFFNAGLSVQTTFSNNMENITLIIVQKIFIYIVTIISVVNNFLKYEELTTNHKHAASAFSELYHNIQTTMCMYRKDRQNAVKYISNMLKKYDLLIHSSPSVDTKNKNDQIMYDTINKLQKIDIIVEPNSELPKTQAQTNLIQMNEIFKIEGDLGDNEKIISPKTQAMKNRQQFEFNRLFGDE
jgi:hypothetical protein